MTKGTRVTATACLALGTLSFIWILCDLFLIATDLEGVLFGAKGLIVGLGYIPVLILHGAAFLLVLMLSSRLRGYPVLKTGSMSVIIVSLFMIAVQKVMYDEVGREIKFGMENAGEIVFVNLGLVANALLCLLAVGLAIFSLRKPRSEMIPDQGEPIFTMAQYMGIVSGFLGLYLTLSLMARQIPAARLWFYVPFYLLFLVPYGLTASFWLALKRKEHIEDWYDEKQRRDLTLAGLTTLLLSIPVLAVFLFLPDPIGVYWYPYHLFTVLLLLSGSTLYFYKRS